MKTELEFREPYFLFHAGGWRGWGVIDDLAFFVMVNGKKADKTEREFY